ncbi:MAG: hypothetical protein IJB33_05550 [Akkermansia sp.]|nr:hypothetical protein [Akkermansia sp.]
MFAALQRFFAQRSLLRWVALVALLPTGCYPPPPQYPFTPLVTERRSTLQENLLALLPEETRKLPAAQQEARWLADTAYQAAAAIARINNSNFPGWAGNALINAYIQDRGLCWHYQHDMYRELRRRKLSYFRIGCCVRDKSELTEHNCVYISAAESHWPEAWVLDAWMWNGRLKVDRATELDAERWQDLPEICDMLAISYQEEHPYPSEYWFSVRCNDGRYIISSANQARQSEQYHRMYENIQKGRKEHPGKLTNY